MRQQAVLTERVPVSTPDVAVQVFWRIGSDTPDYTADDLSGTGAKRFGGRWNQRGIPMVYASSSRALACLETVVHLGSVPALPLNRYLVRLEIPDRLWRQRTLFDPDQHIGWDALPPGRVSMAWGSAWATRQRSCIAQVPSVVVPEEANLLLNPRHPDAAGVRAQKVRRWLYDPRAVPRI